MHIARRFRIAATLGLTLLGAQAAQACEVWRDDLGRLRTNCKLSLARKDYVLSVAVAEGLPRYQLSLPNLNPRKNKVFVTSNQVDLHVDVRNLGNKNAPATDLALMVDIIDPLNLQAPIPQAFTVAVPAIAVGATTRVFVSTILLPNRSQDWDLSLLSFVDPPTVTQSLGRVWESNEMDNSLHRECRIYGPDPNLLGPEACN